MIAIKGSNICTIICTWKHVYTSKWCHIKVPSMIIHEEEAGKEYKHMFTISETMKKYLTLWIIIIIGLIRYLSNKHCILGKMICK